MRKPLTILAASAKSAILSFHDRDDQRACPDVIGQRVRNRRPAAGVTVSMSEQIGHECGIALVRLLKPLSYYQEKYGSPLWGFTKLFLLMEKQHNRGQDGAGVACVKLDMPAGEPYMFRERNMKPNPLDRDLQARCSSGTRAGQCGHDPPRVSGDGQEALRLRRGALPRPPALRHARRLQRQRLPPVFPPQLLADPESRAVRQLQHDQHARS